MRANVPSLSCLFRNWQPYENLLMKNKVAMQIWNIDIFEVLSQHDFLIFFIWRCQWFFSIQKIDITNQRKEDASVLRISSFHFISFPPSRYHVFIFFFLSRRGSLLRSKNAVGSKHGCSSLSQHIISRIAERCLEHELLQSFFPADPIPEQVS